MLDLHSAPRLDHLKRLCGDHGIIQFSRGDEPDLGSGFCLDDNVRLLVACVAIRAEAENAFARSAGERALEFIEEAGAHSPQFHNMMDQYGRFTDRFASPESIGRLIRALGITLRDSTDERWLSIARAELHRASTALAALSTEHARAFAVLGFAAAVEAGEAEYRAPLRAGAEAMLFELGRNASPQWYWPLSEMSYDNGRLPEALLRAGTVLNDQELRREGMRVLEFLGEVVQPKDRFEPIGAPGWYPRGGTRPCYAQQPLEAQAMMEAWLAAGERAKAEVAYDWFLGNNLDGLCVADLATGGCRDAIDTPGKLNMNMGAESTLAYVQAAMNACALDQNQIVA